MSKGKPQAPELAFAKLFLVQMATRRLVVRKGEQPTSRHLSEECGPTVVRYGATRRGRKRRTG